MSIREMTQVRNGRRGPCILALRIILKIGCLLFLVFSRFASATHLLKWWLLLVYHLYTSSLFCLLLDYTLWLRCSGILHETQCVNASKRAKTEINTTLCLSRVHTWRSKNRWISLTLWPTPCYSGKWTTSVEK